MTQKKRVNIRVCMNFTAKEEKLETKFFQYDENDDLFEIDEKDILPLILNPDLKIYVEASFGEGLETSSTPLVDLFAAYMESREKLGPEHRL